MRITTEDIKSEDRLCMKSNLRRNSEKGVFHIHFPFSGLNFSNNIPVPQVRFNVSETEHNTTFEISQQLTFRINPFIIL